MDGSLAFMMLVYLGAALVMAPLTRKLGFSSVIGYILGGIVIGPSVLKLTGNSQSDVMHATEFGVVMLLFLVGLELEPRKFWGMRRKILGLGLSQILATTLVLFVLFYLCGWSAQQSLAIGLCFSISSTAIVLQELQEKNLMNTAAGRASFSTLLFQDIAFIPILAILPFLAGFHPQETETQATRLISHLPEWLQSFSVLIGVAVLIVLGRYVFVPFLRYVSRSNLAELLTAAALFLVIGVSEMMIAVGLSPALGAFIAGVMLANSEFRHELESQIDPFKGLLLAVFFVSVGATIDFNIIISDAVFIGSAVGAVIAVKFLILFCLGKIFKLSNDQNFLYAFGLSQIGEFAFVLLGYSGKLYLFPQDLNEKLMAVAALSMMVTPVLILLNEHYIAPHFNTKLKEDNELKLPDMMEPRKIIIVGFGNFGSTVGRLLRANKVRATVLDNDSDRVRVLRSYGFKVYYGDARRLSILKTAGAAEADMLVICLSDSDDNRYIAALAKEHFPNLKIFVRARDREDAYHLLNEGIDNIYRETLGTAVDMAVDVLQANGIRRYAARRMGKRFELIDKAAVRKLAPHYRSDDDVLFTTRGKEELQRESELLAYDSISIENPEMDTHPDLDEDKNEA